MAIMNDKVGLEILLPRQKMGQLEALAREYGQDPATLASIWVVDRLIDMGGLVPIPEPPATPSLRQPTPGIALRCDAIQHGDMKKLCLEFLSELEQRGYKLKPLGKRNVSAYDNKVLVLRVLMRKQFFSVRIKEPDGTMAEHVTRIRSQGDVQKLLGKLAGIHGT